MSDQLDTLLDNPAPTETPGGDLLDSFVTSLTTDTETPPAAPEETPPATPEEAPPSEPEKPASTEDEIPEAPKNRKDWDTLRGSRDRWKTEAEEIKTVLSTKDQTIQTLQQQLEELQAKASRLPELEDKLKDFDTYEKELAVTRLEATREYRETIAKPLQVIGEQADTLAKSNESNTDAVLAMLREADPAKQRTAFKELTTGWDDVDKSELWSMAKDARVLLDKQDLMRENASAAAKEQAEIAAKREAAEKEASRKAYNESLKDVAKALREKTPFVPTVEGETEDDRYLSLEQKVAAVDFDSQTPRGKAFAAAAAILHPQMVKTIQKLQGEVETLRARVKDSNSTRATVSPTDKGGVPTEDPKDFLEALGIPTNNSLNVVL